jgi:hypothetical protein
VLGAPLDHFEKQPVADQFFGRFAHAPLGTDNDFSLQDFKGDARHGADLSSSGPLHPVAPFRQPLDHRIAPVALKQEDPVFFRTARAQTAFDLGTQTLQSVRIGRKAVHRGDGFPVSPLGFAPDAHDAVTRRNGRRRTARTPAGRAAAGGAHPAVFGGIHDTHRSKFSKNLPEMQAKSCLDYRAWNSYTLWNLKEYPI